MQTRSLADVLVPCFPCSKRIRACVLAATATATTAAGTPIITIITIITASIGATDSRRTPAREGDGCASHIISAGP